jgi:predicted CxxxxCH...CXXCH cytochrome family protein
MATERTRSNGTKATWSLGVAVAFSAFAALVPPGCLKTHEQAEADPDVAECTSCHGDPTRAGDSLAAAAPPYDLDHQTAPGYPGVGAHSMHLYASDTHAAVACDECHTVPDDVDSPGHADTDVPAELVFGELAKTGDLEPHYEAKQRTCVDSYCHGASRPVWSEPRTSDDACGSCHGLPPPAPHPQSEKCSACHGEVIDDERRFVAPERHVNGEVDYDAGACVLCHGNDDNTAPPLDTSGNDAITARGVGAHQTHLAGGVDGRPVECDECHRVPESIDEPTHADGLPAEVIFSGVATTGDRTASFDPISATCSAFCHSPSPGDVHTSPAWIGAATLECTSCHGAPPPAPHPQMTTCSMCHAEVIDSDDRTIVEKNLHVNGIVEVAFDDSCNACHGGTNAAPPLDLDGNRQTTASGVGAHQTHMLGTERSRAVPCDECHLVPRDVFDPGHVDTDRPAELVFSGAALAFGASPSYEDGTCSGTSCHGPINSADEESGGTNTTPTWTIVDGTEAACGSCHGLPPPPPHPLPTYPCHQCHMNIDQDMTFVEPDLHVDGIVTFALE